MFRLVLLSAVAAVLLPGAAVSTPNTTLNALVGPGFNISLKDAGGTAVTHLDPGTYTINVDDQSALHNFHLIGPGVDQATDLEGTGTATWTVTFVDGTYKFMCDAHPVQMKGSFTVGAVPPPPTVLKGRVTARAISLTSNGVRVRTLKAGPVKVVVSDLAKTQNFHLSGPGVNRKTGVASKRGATWNLQLSAGTYVYHSDRNRRLSGRFTVTAA